MSIVTNKQKIHELLTRGVDEVIDCEHLKKQLESGKKLRVKLGIDPTSPHLHLGRSVPLLKLRDFQELGHKVVFIVGDFTGVIGDTSDKESERPMLAAKVVKENLKTYIQQVGKIIDVKKAEIHYNSTWLGKLKYTDIAEQANMFSLAEFIARDNIRNRLSAGTRVSLREILYPLMQGYDSVATAADVEVGGTDQRFNLLAGRSLQPHFGGAAQDIIMNPLVEGTDGRKMSSSWGNTINFTDEPQDMFGKVMSIADDLIVKYFEYFTRIPMADVRGIAKRLSSGGNPRDEKMKLAHEIVCMYHSKKDADRAQEHFISVFSKKEKPDDMPSVKAAGKSISDALVAAKIASSKSDARRLIEQGGVQIDDVVVKDAETPVKRGSVIQKGKRFFMKVA